MATHNYIDLEIPEASYLADLIGIQYDLETTIEWCNQIENKSPIEMEAWFLEAITTAILIRFMRAFGGGVRSKNTKHLLSETFARVPIDRLKMQ